MSGQKASKSANTKNELSFAVKSYLFVYNGAQVAGWSYILYRTFMHYLQGGTTDNLWPVVGNSLIYFQNAAIVEVLNVLLGYVRSPISITFVQVLSRVAVVGGLLYPASAAQVSIGLPLILTAWSITEIIRYSFYAFNLINAVPYFLVWCRYTFFYALYPIGVTGELLLYYATQNYVAETKMWTAEMPNAANFTFNYRLTLLLIMAFYVPQFPQMYLHMINQRKKVIGGASSAAPAPSTSKKVK
uniref:Very-long-chain (3R)-3-hydroxyacyl-CoA dehydratase n=1 Tax=Lygus hesperus TaxID=30085 RepID=A0A0K8TFH5_LYGHE